jgi:hypothetical protein
MKKILVILITAIPLFCLAQKQGNIWYFGNYAGVDFNSGNPTALLNGQLGNIGNEGTSAISDSSGSILLYSNGMTVWNKNNQIMQNGTGLLGNYSSTQSSIIVPDPSDPNRYFYIFTVSSGFCCGGNISDGLRYSKVDICIDSARGGIIPTEKNIKIVDTVAEKVAVTRHSNGSDYWILTHKFYSNEFWALLLSSNGIIDTVISAVGSIHTGSTAGTQGQLKFSPNGQKIAIGASNGLDILEIFDFDKSTGIVSNALTLLKPNNNHASIYGVEFSSDNSKFYASGNYSLGPMNSFLAQYDLSAGNVSAINASMIEIYSLIGQAHGNGLQIATNNKIYWVSVNNPYTLAVLNYPNILGLDCDYHDSIISLAGRQGSYTLPSFISNFDYSNGLNKCNQNGISENTMNKNWSIYPNPFSQNTTLKFQNTANEKIKLSVYNSFGKLLFSINNITTEEVKIERVSLPDGLYLFQLLSDRQVIANGKFIIKE